MNSGSRFKQAQTLYFYILEDYTCIIVLIATRCLNANSVKQAAIRHAIAIRCY